jgi:hypothetical protein
MIELNLTYEESKKIIELGYDFRKISTDFVTKSGRGKLKRVNDILAVDAGIKIADINQCPHDLPDFFYFVESEKLIPIIPKAALEACLPDYLRYEDKHTWAGHTSICLAYGTGEDLTIENYTTEHESAFEAFMWCHEYYPEELKRKFDEVMA